MSRTHSGAIDSLYGRINLNSRILIKYVDIKNQVADVLTKGRFTRHEWNHLLCLLNIMNFSMFSCSHFFLANRKQSAMSQIGQEGNLGEGNPGEGSAMAKPKSMNLVMARPRPGNLVSHNFFSARENSRQGLSDSNNPENAKAEQGGASTSIWKQRRDTGHNPAQ